MQTLLQVVFHGMDHSDAIETRISEEMEKLEKIYGRITNCRVTVESPHRSQRKGALYDIGIHLGLPGTAVDISTANNPAHSDINVAVGDAFDTLSRKLREYHSRQHNHRG